MAKLPYRMNSRSCRRYWKERINSAWFFMGPEALARLQLALQLGFSAEKKDNWRVWRVERDIQPRAIEELEREHDPPAQVLLIIDYAEAARSLAELAQEMERANRDSGHRFRFIATCRASALSAVREALEERTYQPIEFSGKPDDRYANWVVEKILSSRAIPHANDIAQVCAGLPVLAAFAVFLFKRYPQDFDTQFGHIHRGDDFAAWADKRLRLALRARGLEDQPTRRLLAAIAARLPLSAGEYYALRSPNNESGPLLNVLKDDRWIESDGEGVAAAHDIFTDAIVARYIFEALGTITDRVGDVLADAVDAEAFDRALIAVTRLAAHKWFGEIDGLRAIRRAHARSPEPIITARELLLKTRLPDERTCIRIFAALPDVANAVAADMSCDGLLSYLAEVTAASKDEGWRDEAASIVQPFLDRAVERPHQSNMIVRRSLRLLPARYRDQALTWIRREPTRPETHFLLAAWLRASLPLDEMASDVEVWLYRGGATHPKASFVFQAWLDAAAKLDKAECKEKIEIVEPHVLAWLPEHRTAEAAGFVYQAWLDAAAKLDKAECKIKIEIVEPHVLAWLPEHRTAEAAGFVYQAWLDAAAKLDKAECKIKIEIVEPHVLAWLPEHRTAEAAGFVYPAWLKAAAKLDETECAKKIAMVEPHVLAWLDKDKHGAAEAAGFVYQAWLDAAAKLDKAECKEKIEIVEPHVLAWLSEHRTAEAAGFVYQAWLDAAAKLDKAECKEKIEIVEPHVLAWLPEHRTAEAAGFVYQAWLDAAAKLDKAECKEKIEIVEPHVLAWLPEHRTAEAAGFVYKAWLDAAAKLDKAECKEKVEIVEPHVLAWLPEHRTAKAAGFVYQAWLDAGGSADRIRSSMIGWLTVNLGHQKSDFIIKAWLAATHDFATVRVPALLWLKQNTNNPDAVFVLKYITQERAIPPDAIEDAISWCENFPANFDSICRIGRLLPRFATGLLERRLSDVALLVLQNVQLDWIADKGVRNATLATLGQLVRKARFRPSITPSLDSFHAKILRQTKVYAMPASDERSFILNPTLATHVSEMLERGVVKIENDLSALETFANWLASWPEPRKTKLFSSLQLLEQACPVPGLWTRVNPHVVQPQGIMSPPGATRTGRTDP